ncbi:MAG: DUF4038 domain-containing protein [Verrucomicrobiae bacterium]|nr:DUF4038 domain-containing protein [Verrucomicrobiae bacterium]
MRAIIMCATIWMVVISGTGARGAAGEAAADGVLFRSVRLDRPEMTVAGMVNRVTELEFSAKTSAGDPFLETEIDVIFSEPDGGGEIAVPAFWAGADRWKARYAPRLAGRHPWRIAVTKGQTVLGEPCRGVLEAAPYTGANALLRHGPVRLSENGRHFAHADGTPFFWLADSWWHGMTSRLTEDGFRTLVADRVAKGFNVIQLAVANPCDIAPFDERGANDAGHAWTEDFGTINPAYWDLTDRRITYLVDHGLMPSIVASWGYYVHFMGADKMRRHWRYVIARYGAFPVAWILCGESRLPWYPLINKGDDGYRQTLVWTELSKQVSGLNTTRRLLGVHPGPPLWFHDATYPALADYSAIDVYYGMGGHGGNDEYAQVLRCLEDMADWRKANPGKPSIVGELCWEGMYGGNCGPFIQRIQFWGAVLNGAPGHCYGTDSLWQMNSRKRPFGESVQGYTWGNWPWEEAMHWPGSTYVGVGKRILEKFPWWRFEPHPEWLSQTEEKDGRALVAAAAGIPGELRLIYLARKTKQKLLGLGPDTSYAAAFVSPIDGREYPLEEPLLSGPEGTCAIPRSPINQDWVLVVRPRGRGAIQKGTRDTP